MKLYDVAFSMIVVLHYRGLRAACWLWGRGLPLRTQISAKTKLSRPLQQVFGGIDKRMLKAVALPLCWFRMHSDLIAAGEYFIDGMKTQRSVRLKLFLGKQLISRALMRIAWKTTFVVDNIIVLVAGYRRLDVKQYASPVLRINNLANGAVRTVRGGMGRKTPGSDYLL